MIKLLIVEDENSSLEGLKHLILANGFSVEIITASNGHEGYSKAIIAEPDIIISDIKMPVWDGLTMIEHLKRANVSSRILLLTGYAEFTYAQKAIALGVDDYVLKPVSPSELLTKLKDLINQINESHSTKNAAANTHRLYLTSEEDLGGVQEQLVRENYQMYCAGILHIDNSTHLMPELKQFLSTAKDTYLVITPWQDYRGFIVGFTNTTAIGPMLLQIQNAIRAHDSIVCIYELLSDSASPNWLDEFKKLKHCIAWSITKHLPIFEYTPDMEVSDSQRINLKTYKKALQELYFAHRYEECKALICEQINQLQKTNVPPEQIRLTVIAGISNVFSDEEYFKIIQRISTAVSHGELMRCLDDYFDSHAEESSSSGYSRLVQNALTYIRKNYAGIISLSTAAEALKITPQYLSKLFIQETGENFIDYLSNYRIDKAKSLLRNTNLQINEIGRRIGYADPRYFCTLFKKKVGVTPNQFRQSKG